MKSDYALKGRIAIVTGASRSKGIGTAICRELADAGADIFFTHWTPFDATQACGMQSEWPTLLQQELQQQGVRCEQMAVDLSDPEAPGHILDRVQQVLGAPTILVNNAAYSEYDGYGWLNARILDAHYAVNIRGTLLLSVEFARRYAGGPEGRIISMTSGQSVYPMPDELAYIATKGAIEAFTVSLSEALAPRGIAVNAVDPGATNSGWMTEEVRQRLSAASPRGRVGEPEDAARLVAFLASDAAAWISGQIIHSRGSY